MNFEIDLSMLKIQFVELDFSNLIFQKSSKAIDYQIDQNIFVNDSVHGRILDFCS